jgi:uncharacterized protein YecE (DUF72 family)
VARIRVGISGWRYEPWRGTFYPAGLPHRAELEYASQVFSAIEINGSFYSLQRPQYYACWHGQTPPDFVFAVKGGRYITHMKRLRGIEEPLANFFASGVLELRRKLGPLLWQFPPDFKYERARMQGFFELLPRDTSEAGTLARKHAAWMKGRVSFPDTQTRRLRHAVEIRHSSFLDESFIELLREHNIALVTAETARRWPMTQDITADFVYIRLHGDKEIYRSGYGDRALDRWAARIRAWHSGAEPENAVKIARGWSAPGKTRDVYCFFDNTDVKLRAPVDAQALMRKLGLKKPGDVARSAGTRAPSAQRNHRRPAKMARRAAKTVEPVKVRRVAKKATRVGKARRSGKRRTALQV